MKHLKCSFALCLAAILVLPAVPQVLADDWPSWRGPNGNGSTATGNYPTAWNIESVSWKFTLPGKGSSTPILWHDRIYLTTPSERQDAVLALDLQGKQMWLTRLGIQSPPKQRILSSGCKGIFVYFRSGRLSALELDGSVRWTVDLSAKFGPERLYWDSGTSPVLTDDCVILTRLHQGDSWIAAFDKATGTLRWQQKRNYDVPSENDNGYTTPVFFQYQGRPAFLIWGAEHLTAHSASDGSVLWTCGQFNPEGKMNWPTIASPVICGNLAIVPVGRDDRPNQGHVQAIRLDGTGDVTGTHRVWKRDDVGVFVSSLAEYQGRVYLLRPRGNLVCLDPASGSTIWSESLPRTNANFYASPVIANGVLYAAREDGVVFAVRVQDKFELLSENPMHERIIASPAIANGRLLLRGDEHLFCVEMGKR
jgi:outer membrane protein assembly factor BamB